jgi:hypothetical protein
MELMPYFENVRSALVVKEVARERARARRDDRAFLAERPDLDAHPSRGGHRSRGHRGTAR